MSTFSVPSTPMQSAADAAQTEDSRYQQLESELKAVRRANRVLQKQLTRSERTRKEMEAVSRKRESMLRFARQKAEAESAELAEAKAELTRLNKQLESRIEVSTVALSEATDNLAQAKVQVVKSEKFSALGELVAGVAHEINNPIGCITSNVVFVREYGEQLLAHIRLQQSVLAASAGQLSIAALEPIAAHAEDIDLDYIAEDFPNLVESMATSGDRITAISRSLRTFARADIATKQAYELHEGIEGTLLILRHRTKAIGDRPAVTIHKNYGQLPALHCYPGQINQVFMNILANAIDAIDDGKALPNAPEISITTAAERGQILVEISDNAGGMPEAVRSRIFESQFTTKTAGKGTGLGLAIAYQIVTETHGGQIDCRSVLGEGTTFCIALPLDQSNAPDQVIQ